MRKLLLAGLLVALAGCYSAPSHQQMMEADYGSPPPKSFDQIVESRLEMQWVDPESVRYRWDNRGPRRGWRYIDGQLTYGYFICGYVNAKNRLGGYTGPKRIYTLWRDGVMLHYILDDQTTHGPATEYCT